MQHGPMASAAHPFHFGRTKPIQEAFQFVREKTMGFVKGSAHPTVAGSFWPNEPITGKDGYFNAHPECYHAR
jgi:hypothetical protein